MSSCVFISYSSAKSRIAKYSSPTTRPTSPWRAWLPIFLQKPPSWQGCERPRCRPASCSSARRPARPSPWPPPLSSSRLRLRVGGRAPEHAPEHLERQVDPARLVDWGPSVSFDARDEKDHEDALASAAQDLSLPLPGV